MRSAITPLIMAFAATVFASAAVADDAAPTISQAPVPSVTQPPAFDSPKTTILKIVVGTDGSVIDDSIDVSSGSDRLDQAALDWVKQHYRYKPPALNGQPTTATTHLSIVWNLKSPLGAKP